MGDGRKVAIGAGIVTGIGLLAYGISKALAKPKPPIEIPLSAGWNEVTYTGKRQIAGVAFKSIDEYLVLAYSYDTVQGFWVSIVYDTILEPGMVVNIKVSQDCVWRF